MGTGASRRSPEWQYVAHEHTDADELMPEMHPLTNKALEYVRDNLSGSLDGNTVAMALGVSRKTLCKHFKEDTGETFARYVWRKRIELARHLLETTDLEIAQVAYQTGFSSQSHLQTAFKRATGVTPRKWRTGHARLG